MKGLIQFFLLVILVTFISRANAGLLIEPVVGYNLGTTLDIENSDKYDGGTGMAYGGRLGYTNLGLQLGVDYLKSDIAMDFDGVDGDVAMTEMAAFVGFKFPVLLRVYAGYIFSAKGEAEVGTSDYEMTGGSGTKVGLGFTGLPFVNLNVEYRQGSFDELELGGEKYSLETKYKSLMLSASVPFDI